MVFWMMVLTFCSSDVNVELESLDMSRRVVSEVCESGISAVLMNENIKCIILVAGLISKKYAKSGSVLTAWSAISDALFPQVSTIRHPNSE